MVRLRVALSGLVATRALAVSGLMMPGCGSVRGVALRQMRGVCSRMSAADDDGEEEDMHTYAPVRFKRPGDDDATRFVELEALVDTGSTDCELRESFVRLLSLPLEDEEEYETATGTQIERTYRVLVECGGECCEALVTSTAEWRFARGVPEEDEATDEAVLGHQALADLGLLVDCRSRTLVPRGPIAASSFSA